MEEAIKGANLGYPYSLSIPYIFPIYSYEKLGAVWNYLVLTAIVREGWTIADATQSGIPGRVQC